ncbi:MAG: hypothetical protein Q7S27_05030 [Nanoarchaeota archaeon]|nr:hypothetical protein [Nanoarchaeota archaeon]
MCKSICEAVLAIIIILAAIWDNVDYSMWIILVAGIILLVHSFTCKKCFNHSMPSKAIKSSKRRR